MLELIEKLKSQKYRLSETLETQVVAALANRPCRGSFLTGPAGAGKTFLAESVAQVEEYNPFFFQAFPGCRKEELFQTILPDASQVSGFRTLPGVLPLAAKASQDGRTALILDEWDKTHPSTDAFLLDFLQTGRVSLPGSLMQANQENLLVFITLNDERVLSEPLLRRMPLIELQPPAALLVAQALSDTHEGHPHLGTAITLYRRSRLVNLSKPVTIQELRQLLNAITLVGERADWNQLVFQFVTKNWDDHEILKSAESLPLEGGSLTLEKEIPSLSPESYEGSDLPPHTLSGEAPRMPAVHREWLARIPSGEIEADPTRIFGVVKGNESGYDGVARALMTRKEGGDGIKNPADLRIAKVGDQEIIVFEALDFARMEEWGLILKDGGELLLETQHKGAVTREMMLGFRPGNLSHSHEEGERCRIYSLTDSEILMRFHNLKIRWTPEVLEVVTKDFQPTRELWAYLYGPKGLITATLSGAEGGEEQEDPAISEEQVREHYLYVLRDFRHLKAWFSLLIKRNYTVWGTVTCRFRNKTIIGSALAVAEFHPENESPATKEEAESIAMYNALSGPAQDFYETNITHIESELIMYVAKNGELPPGVEDGGIFSLFEVHSDLDKIKREGLKLYMRTDMREA